MGRMVLIGALLRAIWQTQLNGACDSLSARMYVPWGMRRSPERHPSS